MTEEEIKQQQEAEAEAERLKKAEEDKKASENIDYKTELEKVKTQLGQAEHVILKLKSEKEENKDDAPDDEDKGGGNAPDGETIKEIARKEAAKLFINSVKSQARSFARTQTQNEDEVNLIMFHYENTISPTGDIEKDIKRARLIANEGRISKDLEQAKRAALSKELKGMGGGGSGEKQPQEDEEPQMSEKSQRLLVQAGLRYDPKRKGYVGKSGRLHSLAEINASLQSSDK